MAKILKLSPCGVSSLDVFCSSPRTKQIFICIFRIIWGALFDNKHSFYKRMSAGFTNVMKPHFYHDTSILIVGYSKQLTKRRLHYWWDVTIQCRVHVSTRVWCFVYFNLLLIIRTHKYAHILNVTVVLTRVLIGFVTLLLYHPY